MKRHLRSLLLPLAAALPLALLPAAHGQISGPAPAQEKPLQYQLPNGMTVIIKPDRRAPTAVHMLYVRVGALNAIRVFGIEADGSLTALPSLAGTPPGLAGLAAI